MKEAPDEQVMAWYRSIDASAAYTTAVNVAELHYGIQRLPAGKRRDRLSTLFQEKLAKDFDGKVLAFDTESAQGFAIVTCTRQAAGRPIDVMDAQIAAICARHSATLATRNTRDFEDTGVTVVNPFSASI
jgi:predicted nucleic acid-binding protein